MTFVGCSRITETPQRCLVAFISVRKDVFSAEVHQTIIEQQGRIQGVCGFGRTPLPLREKEIFEAILVGMVLNMVR